MQRDKNADKRLEYNRKIASKERESDELYLEERQVKNQIENFEIVMMQGFRKLQEIEDNINKRGTLVWNYDETFQKQKYLSNVIRQQQEGLEHSYRSVRFQVENEREQLQRERDNLAWD